MKNIQYLESPIGRLGLIGDENYLVEILFEEELNTRNLELYKEENQHILQKAKEQLTEYFAGDRTRFTVPLQQEGTAFQQRVWNALIKVKYGTSATYKDIAEEVGSPKGARAVGMANNKNKIPIIIPCHRIVGSSGKMIGYAGGLEKKEILLALEKNAERQEVSKSDIH